MQHVLPTTTNPIRARFAPSPTGRMHAGNIYAALIAWLLCKQQQGTMVLRIEDLDPVRSRQEYASMLMHDLEFFGLTWDDGPYYQHDRDGAYQQAFETLKQIAHVYPCFCTRAELAASAPHAGENRVYAGTCKRLTAIEQFDRTALLQKQGRGPSLRLAVTHETIEFYDNFQGNQTYELDTDCGDFVVRRADGGFSYQLAVVVDDAEHGITQVSRGCDLLLSTPLQIFLQHLLDLPRPSYAHFPLLVTKEGRRLSKRDHDASLDSLLQEYKTAEGILGHIAYKAGLIQVEQSLTAQDLLETNPLEALSGRQAIIW